jgi:hypothetical protein
MSKRPTPQERLESFLKFHHENPKVYELFSKFTHMVVARGFQHYSADGIFHRIRWHTGVDTTDPEYKIGDHMRVFYGKLWAQKNPRHADLFRTKDTNVADAFDVLNEVRNYKP